jgi:hypothetical protein
MPFTVYIDECNHPGDEEGRYRHGEYDTLDAAIAECRRIVDDFLEPLRKPGTSAEELFRIYSLFAEEPFIIGPVQDTFSAHDYARSRCAALADGVHANPREKLPPRE